MLWPILASVERLFSWRISSTNQCTVILCESTFDWFCRLNSWKVYVKRVGSRDVFVDHFGVKKHLGEVMLFIGIKCLIFLKFVY